MSALLFTQACIATSTGHIDDGWLLTDDRTIVGFGDGTPDDATISGLLGAGQDPTVIAAEGHWLLPGFVDVHVHGALGHEAMDGEVDGLAEMASFYARHGVTAFLATTWTATTSDTLHALTGIAAAVTEIDGGARLLGAHMEGPYLSPRRCGAQDAELIRAGDLEEVGRFLDTGVVRLITIAPEVAGNLEVIAECTRRGAVVSAGHTDATYEQMVAGIEHGVRHVTHTFNAMRPLHHREPGPVGAALTMPELSVELIADGIHVGPVVMAALYAARGPDGVVLVTDAMRATGMPPGGYAVGDRTVVLADGAVRLPNGALAGSVLTLDRALDNLRRATGAALSQLWPTSSRNASRVARIADRKGIIALGWDADLVLVDDDVGVELTVVEGRVVHRRPATPPTDVPSTIVRPITT